MEKTGKNGLDELSEYRSHYNHPKPTGFCATGIPLGKTCEV